MHTFTGSSLWAVLLMLGASTRLTRLITTDAITAPLRAWAMRVTGNPDAALPAFLRCAWCVGMWWSVLVVVWAWCDARHHHHCLFYPAALALSLSQLVGMILTHDAAKTPPAPAAPGLAYVPQQGLSPDGFVDPADLRRRVLGESVLPDPDDDGAPQTPAPAHPPVDGTPADGAGE